MTVKTIWRWLFVCGQRTSAQNLHSYTGIGCLYLICEHLLKSASSAGKAVCIQTSNIRSKFASSAGKAVCIHQRTSAHLQERLFESGYLFVPQWISSERKNITFHVHPKSEDEIQDQWRTCRQKRNIYKPGPDTSG